MNILRPDRENLIAAHKENIEQGKEKNFEKRNWGQADYLKNGGCGSSLLCTGPQEFSKNGENFVILPPQPS